MAYQKKYYFSFKQLGTDDVNLVEIWQDTVTVLTAEEVTGLASPFVTEINELDHKFQPVIGQGCEIGLLSKTDRKFFDGLYHVDAQEFMVKHYINSSLNYIGYLNSEMYLENYDSSVNYGTSITGNDGLAIADRFTFLQADESKYTEILSEWDILIICLNKIALPWDEIRTSISTTFTGYSGTISKTVFHETYIDSANFYDEDDYPMTIREVMESILKPYGAQLFIESGHVYIVDVNSRTLGIDSGFITSTIFKRFTYSTEAYIGTLGIALNKTIQTIGYSGSGQSIELSGGVNKQVVTYSPYPTSIIIENSLIGLDEFTTVPDTWTAREDYYYRTLTGNAYLQINEPSLASFESSYYDGTVKGNSVRNGYDGYLSYQFSGSYLDVAELKNPPYVTISSKETIIVDGEPQGAGISIEFDFLATFTDSRVYRYMVLGGGTYIGFRIYLKLSIGNLFYDGETETWVADSSKTFYIEFIGLQREKWVSVSKIIKVGNASSDTLLSGNLNLYVNSKIEGYGLGLGWRGWYNIDYLFTRDVMVWIKNLNIDVKNADKSTIPDDDVEYVGILDERFKSSGEKIELTTGTDTYSSDRAKMLYISGTDTKSIETWTRYGQTYKIEELLLNSLVSNYRFGFIKLNNMRLKQGFSILNVFTDNNIDDKVFMLKSAKFDFEANDVECSFWETSPDRLTIVK